MWVQFPPPSLKGERITKRISAIWTTPTDSFHEIADTSNTMKEMLIRLGVSYRGHSYDILKKRLEEEGYNVARIAKRGLSYAAKVTNARSTKKIPLIDILVQNSTYTSTSLLKKRLIKAGILREECSECCIGPTWNGKPLSLQLDHKNGEHTDNRLENLRLLCPNCHSQTDTFVGKKKRKKKIFHYCRDCGDEIGSRSKRCRPCHNKNMRKG